MKPGDLMVFYTDGIVEAPGRAPDQPAASSAGTRARCATTACRSKEYGLDRLPRVARQHQGQASPGDGVDAVFADVEEYCLGAPVEDDRTLMVVSLPSADKMATAAFSPPPPGMI